MLEAALKGNVDDVDLDALNLDDNGSEDESVPESTSNSFLLKQLDSESASEGSPPENSSGHNSINASLGKLLDEGDSDLSDVADEILENLPSSSSEGEAEYRSSEGDLQQYV